MKKIKSLLPILLIFIFHSCSNSKDKLIGEWHGVTDTGESTTIIMDENDHFFLVIGNYVIGGDNYLNLEGKPLECKYEIDYSKNPIWLDIISYEKSTSKEIYRLRGIVRFISENKIEIRLNNEGNRYNSFDPEDNKHTIIVDKRKL